MNKKQRNRSIPTKLTENQFSQFSLKHLPKRQRDPVSKISVFKIFNYVMKFLYTSCQWKELPIDSNSNEKPEIHYTRVFRIFKHWIRSDVFTKIFENSVAVLKQSGLLDTSILHGDGTTTTAKKGGDNIGYNGHKHMKGDKIVAFCDRFCNVIAPFVTAPGNRNEAKCFQNRLNTLKELPKIWAYPLKIVLPALILPTITQQPVKKYLMRV